MVYLVYNFEIGLTSCILALSSPAPNDDKIYYWHDVYSRYNNVFSWRVGIHWHEGLDLAWIQFDINAFIRTVDATIKTTSLNSRSMSTVRLRGQIILTVMLLQQKHLYIEQESFIAAGVLPVCRFRESNQTKCHGVTYVVRPALDSLYPSCLL